MTGSINIQPIIEEIQSSLEIPSYSEHDKGFDDGLEHVLDLIENAPTLTPPNEWVSVEERLPEPGERVLATDCGFVGEFYINKRGKWQRYNVNCSELLMALDILYWMPLPAPPSRRPPEGEVDA